MSRADFHRGFLSLETVASAKVPNEQVEGACKYALVPSVSSLAPEQRETLFPFWWSLGSCIPHSGRDVALSFHPVLLAGVRLSTSITECWVKNWDSHLDSFFSEFLSHGWVWTLSHFWLYLNFCFCFLLDHTPHCSCLLLVLSSGTTPGGLRGARWDDGDWTQVGMCARQIFSLLCYRSSLVLSWILLHNACMIFELFILHVAITLRL